MNPDTLLIALPAFSFLVGSAGGFAFGCWYKSQERQKEQSRQAEIDSAVKAALDREKKSGDQ